MVLVRFLRLPGRLIKRLQQGLQGRKKSFMKNLRAIMRNNDLEPSERLRLYMERRGMTVLELADFIGDMATATKIYRWLKWLRDADPRVQYSGPPSEHLRRVIHQKIGIAPKHWNPTIARFSKESGKRLPPYDLTKKDVLNVMRDLGGSPNLQAVADELNIHRSGLYVVMKELGIPRNRPGRPSKS